MRVIARENVPAIAVHENRAGQGGERYLLVWDVFIFFCPFVVLFFYKQLFEPAIVP